MESSLIEVGEKICWITPRGYQSHSLTEKLALEDEKTSAFLWRMALFWLMGNDQAMSSWDTADPYGRFPELYLRAEVRRNALRHSLAKKLENSLLWWINVNVREFYYFFSCFIVILMLLFFLWSLQGEFFPIRSSPEMLWHHFPFRSGICNNEQQSSIMDKLIITGVEMSNRNELHRSSCQQETAVSHVFPQW